MAQQPSEKTIFVITPIGDKRTTKRAHADKMWNSVFLPIEKEFQSETIRCRCVRGDLGPEGNKSRIKEIMNHIKNAKGCIVDLYDISNLNVMYEVGLAHSQGKRVFFLRSDKIGEEAIPADLRPYADDHFQYNVEIFDGEASANEETQLRKAVSEVVRKMVLGDADTNLYRPTFYEPTEEYTNGILRGINEKLLNLENLISDLGSSSEDQRTLAQYITGENAAFDALTAAIKNSRLSVKTTRFSPYTVVGRQSTFFNTINELMSNPEHPDSFERIIAANSIEKWTEVMQLMVSNAGKDFKIYISKIEYSFEMVVIDDEVVFIHFRKYNGGEGYDTAAGKQPTLISATLKIEKRLIAAEFSQIFDSITGNTGNAKGKTDGNGKDIAFTIDCKKITSDEDLLDKLTLYKKQFKDAVDELKRAATASTREV